MKRVLFSLLGLVIATVPLIWFFKKPTLTVGSKPFTENYILAEIMAQIIEGVGETSVKRRFGLGQTGIAYQALKNQKIDLYPEYTGTISEVLLKRPDLSSIVEIQTHLEKLGLTISQPFGFNNTYAIGVKKESAEALGLKTIGDLNKHPRLKPGFSHEFLNREDGYLKIRKVYGLSFGRPQGITHALGYQAIERNEIQLMDIYSTDAKVAKLKLTLLVDDKNVFPKYFGVILARKDLGLRFPKTWGALRQLEGAIDERGMVKLNALVELGKKSFSEVARTFLRLGSGKKGGGTEQSLWELTQEHVALVLVSLLASMIMGVPLAIVASRSRIVGQFILMVIGVHSQRYPNLGDYQCGNHHPCSPHWSRRLWGSHCYGPCT